MTTATDVLARKGELIERMSTPGFQAGVDALIKISNKERYYVGTWNAFGESGQRLCEVESSRLRISRTYQVTPTVLDLANELTKNFRGRALDPMEVPCDVGYIWFDEPRYVKDLLSAQRGEAPENAVVAIRMITWARAVEPIGYYDIEADRRVMAPESQGLPGLRVNFYTDLDDSRSWLSAEAEMSTARERYGRFPLVHSLFWAFHSTYETAPNITEDNEFANVYLSRFLHVLFMLFEQEIITHEPGQVQRQARRQAERKGISPMVNVVLLRRVKHQSDPDHQGRRIEWQCRWIVQGHWRHLPGVDENGESRRTWVRSYIKGPEGKPLRIGDTVYRLAR